jgi:hypothetical protein
MKRNSKGGPVTNFQKAVYMLKKITGKYIKSRARGYLQARNLGLSFS